MSKTVVLGVVMFAVASSVAVAGPKLGDVYTYSCESTFKINTIEFRVTSVNGDVVRLDGTFNGKTPIFREMYEWQIASNNTIKERYLHQEAQSVLHQKSIDEDGRTKYLYDWTASGLAVRPIYAFRRKLKEDVYEIKNYGTTDIEVFFEERVTIKGRYRSESTFKYSKDLGVNVEFNIRNQNPDHSIDNFTNCKIKSFTREK